MLNIHHLYNRMRRPSRQEPVGLLPAHIIVSWLELLNAPELNREPQEDFVERRLLHLHRRRFPLFSTAAGQWANYCFLYWQDLRPETHRLFMTPNTFNFVQWALEYARESFPDIFRTGVNAVDATITLRDRLCNGTITPLHMAAILGLPQLCQDLIESGADVQQDGPIGTPLYCAFIGPSVIKFGTRPRYWTEVLSLEPTSSRADAISNLLDAGASCTFKYEVQNSASSVDGAKTFEFLDGVTLAGLSFWSASISGRSDLFQRLIDGGATFDDNLFLILDNERKALHERHRWSLLQKFDKESLEAALTYLLDLIMGSQLSVPWDMELKLLDIIKTMFQEHRLDKDFTAYRGHLKHIEDDEFHEMVRSSLLDQQYLSLRRLASDPRFDPNVPANPGLFDGTIVHLATAGTVCEPVEIFLRNGADVTLTDDEGRTPLLVCENLQVLELLVKKYHLPTTDTDNDGRTLWHYAAATNDAPLITWLCANDPQKEVNMQVKTNSGLTLLDEALHYVETLTSESSFDVPKSPYALLSLLREMRNASIRAESTANAHLGLAWGMVEVLDGLVAVGAPFKEVDEAGNSVLHHLNLSATPILVRKLRDMFPDAAISNNKGETPAETVFLNSSKALKQNYVDPTVNAHLASWSQLIEESYLELLTPKLLDYRDSQGNGLWVRYCNMVHYVINDLANTANPAYYTLIDSMVAGVKCLVQRGAMAEFEKESKRTAIYSFKDNDDSSGWDYKTYSGFFLAILRGSDKDFLHEFCQTDGAFRLMYEAYAAKNYEMVHLLANGGLPLHVPHPALTDLSFINLILTAKSSEPPADYLRRMFEDIKLDVLKERHRELFGLIFEPSMPSRREKLEVLLQLGLDPNNAEARTKEECYLATAISSGDCDIISTLLQHGANPAVGVNGYNALIASAAQSNMAIMAKVVDALEMKETFDWASYYSDDDGVTWNALQMAALHGHDRILLLLLEKTPLRKHINSTTPGNPATPARLAAQADQNTLECLLILRDRRANLQLVDSTGTSPVQVASRRGIDVSRIL